MFLELIASIVAGFGAAGIALLLNRVLGGRLPKWIIPVSAGAAMLATAIANEYGWYGRTVEALPEDVIVAETVEDRAIYRPWSYIFPFVSRFLAVDIATMRTNTAQPGQRMVEVYAFGRWRAPQSRLVMVNCVGGRRADMPATPSFNADGAVEGLDWRETGMDDPIVSTACRPEG